MSFRLLKSDLLFEIKAFEDKMRKDPQPDIVARCLYEIWRRYRAAAISILLTDADNEAFFARLKLAGKTRQRLLMTKSCVEAENGRYARASLLEPFFDTLAAYDEGLARDISARSPVIWNPDYEFEDDFYYAQFLFEFLRCDCRSSPVSASYLEKFKSALESDGSARFDVCTSFLLQDSNLFDGAFDKLIEQWQKFYDDKYRQAPWKDWALLTDRKICVEGLALLHIAERVGLETRYEYSGIPPVARPN